ncbi:MAG: hypothetical protein ACUZ8H_13925 [Candidatus Anammoxibacter sp.]
MGLEGVNSTSALIQGAQQSNVAKTTEKTNDNNVQVSPVENNTEQGTDTSVSQDSEVASTPNEPGALLDVLA